ncbi:MAG TPA: hypothetical protein VGF81_06940 [Solirubrobacteraceae bacterium]|jgi:hypothetical protein
MPTVMIVLNIVLAAFVVVGIVGSHLYAVLTQQRDHGVVAAGPALRRQIWSTGGRARTGSARARYARRPQSSPAA